MRMWRGALVLLLLATLWVVPGTARPLDAESSASSENELAADEAAPVDEILPLTGTGVVAVELTSSVVKLSVCPAPACVGTLSIQFPCDGNLENEPQCKYQLLIEDKQAKFMGLTFPVPTKCILGTIGTGVTLTTAVNGAINLHEVFRPEGPPGVRASLDVSSLPSGCQVKITNAILPRPTTTESDESAAAAASAGSFFSDYGIYLIFGSLGMIAVILVIVLVAVLCCRKNSRSSHQAQSYHVSATPVIARGTSSLAPSTDDAAPPETPEESKPADAKEKGKTKGKAKMEKSLGEVLPPPPKKPEDKPNQSQTEERSKSKKEDDKSKVSKEGGTDKAKDKGNGKEKEKDKTRPKSAVSNESDAGGNLKKDSKEKEKGKNKDSKEKDGKVSKDSKEKDRKDKDSKEKDAKTSKDAKGKDAKKPQSLTNSEMPPPPTPDAAKSGKTGKTEPSQKSKMPVESAEKPLASVKKGVPKSKSKEPLETDKSAKPSRLEPNDESRHSKKSRKDKKKGRKEKKAKEDDKEKEKEVDASKEEIKKGKVEEGK